jgi:hypothetical protein
MDLINGFLNMIFISIPEGIVISFICLLFLSDKNMLDFMMIRYNIKKYLLLIIPNAVVINMIRYIFKVDNKFILLIVGYMTILITLTILYKKFRPITLCIVLLCYIIIIVGETILVSPVLFLLKTNIESVNQDIFCKFFVFLPERIIQLSVLIKIIIKINIDMSNSVIIIIIRNKVLRVIFFAIIATNIFPLIKNGNSIGLYINQSTDLKSLLFYIITKFAYPILNISLYLLVIKYFKPLILTIKTSIKSSRGIIKDERI